MTERSRGRNAEGDIGPTDKPAVGLVAHAGNAEWVASTLVRAHRRGYRSIVVGPEGAEWHTYADALGATTVTYGDEVPLSHDPDQLLFATAKRHGFPGVIIHDTPDEDINLERSVRALAADESYAIEAVTGPHVRGGHVLVGIPAYNEEATIADVVSDASEYADAVVVVDDGSSDRTAERARRAGAAVVKHRRNRGYGGALKAIFQQADRTGADHLVVLDADCQHDPADIPKLIEVQQSTGAELVIGSRFVDDGSTDAPLYRRFGLFVVNSLTNLGCGALSTEKWVHDTQSGFRAYSRVAIESLAEEEAIADRMSASTDVLNHAISCGYAIEEVGTTVSYDVEGANTRHPLTHGMTLVRNLVRTLERQRPLSTLGVTGVMGCVAGLWVAQLTLSRFLTTGELPASTGTASAVLLLSGGLLCIAAVVSHALSVHKD